MVNYKEFLEKYKERGLREAFNSEIKETIKKEKEKVKK